MALYNGDNAGISPTVATIFLGILGTSATIDRIVEWYLGGEATSSTVDRIVVARSTTVGTTTTAITPAKHNPRSAAAVATVMTAYSTQPSFATINLNTLAFNAFGGVVRWVAAPGEEEYVYGSTPDTEITMRSAAGTGTLSADMHFEELIFVDVNSVEPGTIYHSRISKMVGQDI